MNLVEKLAVKNFFSIGQRQEINFGVSPKDCLDDSVKRIKEKRYVNSVAAIVGHNASGKTTYIKAFSFLFWFVNRSYSKFKKGEKIPVESHEGVKNNNSDFELSFYFRDSFYVYSLEVCPEKVVKESLKSKKLVDNESGNPERLKTLFSIDRTKKNDQVVVSKLLSVNKADLDRVKTRSNISFLSALISLEYLSDFTFFDKYETNVGHSGLMSKGMFDFISASEALSENANLKKKVQEFTSYIDLGISDVKLSRVKLQKDDDETKEAPLIRCVHKSEDGEFSLPLFSESNGTQRSFALLSEIFPILEKGGVMFIDEIERGLHPWVVRKIISLFENIKSNPMGAQLIFTTHLHLLLNDRSKTQIFLVEKDNSTSESEIYRLDAVEGVRNDENYFQKYLSGTYGATPDIRWI